MLERNEKGKGNRIMENSNAINIQNYRCEFYGERYCLCDICQSVRKALDEAEKITSAEVEELFREAEELFENMKVESE